MHISIEVEGEHPVVGVVIVAGTPPTPFTGWLALLAVLERVAENPSSEAAANGLSGQLDP